MNLKKINFYQKKAEDFNFLTRLYQIYTIFVLLKPFIEFPFYNIKVENQFKAEKGKNYILAPNHISYLDVFFVNMAYNVIFLCFVLFKYITKEKQKFKLM